MEALILSICLQMGGIDCNTVLSIAKIESALNPKAVGESHGEIGLMQIRPEHHKCATFNPEGNIRCGISYLKRIKKKHFAKHGTCFITFYNYGINSKIKNPCERSYFLKVAKVYKKITDKSL